MSSSSLRQWHAYIGLFIAPSVLFFAITGAIQLFNLHEAHGGYRPPALLEKLSAAHKDQVFEQPRPAPQTGGVDEDHPSDDAEQVRPTTLALKWFFLAVAAGLTVSTAIGVWMGLTQLRRKMIGWSLIAAGALIPVCLLAL